MLAARSRGSRPILSSLWVHVVAGGAWTALLLLWSRPDAIIFILVGALTLLIFGRRAGIPLRSLLCFLPALGLFVLWQFYASHISGESAAARMMLVPQYNRERLRDTIRLGAHYLFFPQYIDPTAQDSLADLMRSSYRRGLTAFVVPF